MKIAITLIACVLSSPVQAKVVCDDLRMTGLDGWDQASRDWWGDRIKVAVTERVADFLSSGSFHVKFWAMNGNTAAISSGTFHRVRAEVAESDSDKVVVGTVSGTNIPVYEIKSQSHTKIDERITVENLAFRLPMRVSDLPRDTRETILISGSCVSGGPAVAGAEYRAEPVRELRAKPKAPNWP